MHYRLMNEYGVDWPFWADGGCPDGEPALPSALDAEIRAWAADFNDQYRIDRGWPSANAMRTSERRGRQLAAAVARVIEPNGDDVEFGHWETNHLRGF